MTTAARPRIVCLLDHEARHFLEHGRALLAREIPDMVEPEFPAYFDAYDGGPEWCWWTKDNRQCNTHGTRRCPFGPVGTRLTCREAWTVSKKSPKIQFAFRADGKCVGVGGDGAGGWIQVFHGWLFPDVTDKGPSIGRTLYENWRPAAQMPLYASRFTIENAGVVVRRCRDVTEEEAIAAGVERLDIEACSREHPIAYRNYSPGHRDPYKGFGNPGESLASLLGRPAAWERNAHLWLCDARRVDS